MDWAFLKKIRTPEESTFLEDRAKIAFVKFAATPGGKDFLDYLCLKYCAGTAFGNDTHDTYARLANKELVESLIKFSQVNN